MRTDDVLVELAHAAALTEPWNWHVRAPRLQAAAVALLHNGQIQVRKHAVRFLGREAQDSLPNDLERQVPELLRNLDRPARAADFLELDAL